MANTHCSNSHDSSRMRVNGLSVSVAESIDAIYAPLRSEWPKNAFLEIAFAASSAHREREETQMNRQKK